MLELAASLEVSPDGVVRYLGNKAKDDTYTVKAATFQRGLRALRLDALADAQPLLHSMPHD